jgi:hypothetical protein
MAKAIRAAIDLTQLLGLPLDTKESEGRMTYPVEGNLAFNDVTFAYPTRAGDPALNKISFQIRAGECVGIVGCVPHCQQLDPLPTVITNAAVDRLALASRRWWPFSCVCTSHSLVTSPSTAGISPERM